MQSCASLAHIWERVGRNDPSVKTAANAQCSPSLHSHPTGLVALFFLSCFFLSPISALFFPIFSFTQLQFPPLPFLLCLLFPSVLALLLSQPSSLFLHSWRLVLPSPVTWSEGRKPLPFPLLLNTCSCYTIWKKIMLVMSQYGAAITLQYRTRPHIP